MKYSDIFEKSIETEDGIKYIDDSLWTLQNYINMDKCTKLQSIKAAKKILDNMLGQDADTLHQMVIEQPNYFMKLIKKLAHRNINKAIAIVAVLCSGSYSSQDSQQFYMPSTKECFANWKISKTILKKGDIQKYLYFWEL